MTFPDVCNDRTALLVAALWFSHSVVEFWMGKTDKVKASSVLELCLTLALSILIWAFRKKKD